MKKWIRDFRIIFIVIGVLVFLWIGIVTIHGLSRNEKAQIRNNQECLTTERVFDYGDKLTTKEEEKLRKLIAKREKQIQCDIVLVTLKEPLSEYVKKYEDKIGPVATNEYVMVYADNFYDEHKFGYDKAIGDGFIYVDNWEKERDGYRYSWLGTSGKLVNEYENNKINHLINKVIAWTNISPYYAYKLYVNTVYYDQVGWINFTYYLPFTVVLLIALLVTGCYLFFHIYQNKGAKTTIATTYVEGGKPVMNRQEDILLSKTVTQRRIEKNTGRSGGGGGGHISAGGSSHGGGGGRH